MSGRRGISARVARRRALLVDLSSGACLAIAAITLASGLGVVAVGALVALLIVLVWVAIETALARASRRSAARRQGGADGGYVGRPH